MQSTQDGPGDDSMPIGDAMATRSRQLITRYVGNAWAQARVRPSPVVMRHPFLDDRTDVSFIQHNHPIQALATHRADQALAERVRLRACTGVFNTVRPIAVTAPSTAAACTLSRS